MEMLGVPPSPIDGLTTPLLWSKILAGNVSTSGNRNPRLEETTVRVYRTMQTGLLW